MLLTGCGAASPWANIIRFEFSNLTQKKLAELGEGSESFEEFAIGLIADPQVMPGYLANAIAKLDKVPDLSFYLILGDLTDRSLRQEFEWVAKAITEADRPVLTVVGNHDGLIYGDEIYRKMFGPLNYSFTYNGVRFVLWNNNPFEWGYPDFYWLRAEVSAGSRVVVGAHQPPGWIERFPEANEEFSEVLKDPNVIASFHGHMHHFSVAYIGGKPVYTVGRTLGTQYGIARFFSEEIVLERCRGESCWRYE
jgi:hypothetical protein